MKQTINSKTSVKMTMKTVAVYAAAGIGMLTVIIFIIVFLYGSLGTPKTVFAALVDTSIYAKEQPLIVDYTKVSGNVDLVDFPMLVKIMSDELKSIANGGYVESNLGYDIVFADNVGNQLNHQIESYDPATGEYVAWVSVPVISASIDTEIKIHFGDATAISNPSVTNVWNPYYQAVWHMENDPSGSSPQLIDGTTNARHGTAFGNMSTADLVAGKIGPALELDGTDDYFKITGYKGVTDKTERTVSLWFKTDRSAYTHSFVSWGKNKPGKAYDVYMDSNNNVFGIGNNGGQKNGSVNIADDSWHYLVVVLPPSSAPFVQDHLLYVDGVLETVS
ncbi:MAG: DUF2341 domain-containing protein, partial [Flavobacteriales bacterium]|nr:DUF2341 domain-containing protein [Flavobacteriales bacterium]